MITYIIYIFFGILLYLTFNLKEKLLIPFSIETMNRCKTEECSSDGDCFEQCMLTSFNDPCIYRLLAETNISNNLIINDYLTNINDTHSQVFVPLILSDRIHNLEEVGKIRDEINPLLYPIRDFNDAYMNLSVLYKQIPPNNSRIVFIIFYNTETREYKYHVVIFSRTNEAIYMLDPKHRVIMKNSDILLNSWFNEKFYSVFELTEEDVQRYGGEEYQESINWATIVNYNYIYYFYPIYNVSTLKGRNTDELYNVTSENALIDELLTTLDNGILNDEENSSYSEWIRRQPDNTIVDPNGIFFPTPDGRFIKKKKKSIKLSACASEYIPYAEGGSAGGGGSAYNFGDYNKLCFPNGTCKDGLECYNCVCINDCGSGTGQGTEVCNSIQGCKYYENGECLPEVKYG